jgi:type IV secretory pathway VirB3-like protein
MHTLLGHQQLQQVFLATTRAAEAAARTLQVLPAQVVLAVVVLVVMVQVIIMVLLALLILVEVQVQVAEVTLLHQVDQAS